MQQQQQGHYAANTDTRTQTHLHISEWERERERERARQIGLTASDGAFLTMRPQHQQQQQEQLHQQQYQQLQLANRWWARRGGGGVRGWGLPRNSLQQMKIPRIFAFAVSFGFCGCQSLFTWLARVIYGLQIFPSSLSPSLCSSFFYFLAIFVFFYYCFCVHCWLVAKREICVAKLHIFIVITRC